MPEKDKNASWDFPSLARGVVEASEKTAPSKLPAGLYVIGTPIGHRGDITLRALAVLTQLDCVACEDTRTTGALLKAYGLHKPLLSYTEHNDAERTAQILRQIQDGQAVGLASEAGMPIISDPGQRLVKACRGAGVAVTVLPGANAAVTALVGSGLAADRFLFLGFSPQRTKARQDLLREMAASSATLVFYESPHRLTDFLQDAEAVLGKTRQACVARELTKLHEESRADSLANLLAHYLDHPPKGEIVVLIAPAADDEMQRDDVDLDALLSQALQNLSLRDAVAMIADSTGVKKSEVYARALEISKEKPSKDKE